jgi:histidinol-phosphate/aromatic aminotransferase/cobyric acid decarboxylase-like protein
MTVLPAGAHGGDGARLAEALGVRPDQILDLSASLNPVAPDPRPIVERHLDAIGRYPDPRRATDAMAAALGASPGKVLLTNGGAEAIALLANELESGWVEEPDFSLYRRHLHRLDRAGPKWRSNPHNPSGLLAAPTDTSDVWDEAFWPLATGTWTRGDENATVIGSLTKLLACPGLRIGYVYSSDEELIARLHRRQPQWSFNGLAADALPDLLETVDLMTWAKETVRLRNELVDTLERHGFTSQPSDANWILIHAPGLRDRLAPHGICIRDCTSFGLPGTVRIAVPNDEQRTRLEKALMS